MPLLVITQKDGGRPVAENSSNPLLSSHATAFPPPTPPLSNLEACFRSRVHAPLQSRYSRCDCQLIGAADLHTTPRALSSLLVSSPSDRQLAALSPPPATTLRVSANSPETSEQGAQLSIAGGENKTPHQEAGKEGRPGAPESSNWGPHLVLPHPLSGGGTTLCNCPPNDSICALSPEPATAPSTVRACHS